MGWLEEVMELLYGADGAKRPKPRQNTEKNPTPLRNDPLPQARARFTDVTMAGAEERRRPIPPRNEPHVRKQTPPVQPRVGQVQTSANPRRTGGFIPIYSPRDRFLQDMKQYANRQGYQVSFVPFRQNWPAYDNMDRYQRAWYFYWRTEVRRGRYPDTDLSYLYVHIYELLSGVGWETPGDGLEQLNRLWAAYRDRFPALDGHLSIWTFDFARLHGLDYSLPEEFDLRPSERHIVSDLLIDAHREEIPLRLPFQLVAALCDYRVTESKFYLDGHRDLMREAIPRVIALADAACRRKNGRGLLEQYGPEQAVKQNHYLFQGAVCPEANKRLRSPVRPYVLCQPLRDQVNELVRYAENVLRALYGYRGRLRGVNPDPELAALMEGFLKKEYAPNRQEEPRRENVDLRLDFAGIDLLRQQSDAVRAALEVPEEPDIPVVTAPQPVPEAREHREETGLSGLLTALSEVQRAVLWAITAPEDPWAQLNEIAEAEMSLPEILVDEINDLAVEYLDDILIDTGGDRPYILEQYEKQIAAARVAEMEE